MAGTDGEEAGQSLRRGIGGVPLGQVLEVATPLRVGACRYQRGGQGHHCAPVCPGQLAASFSDPSKRLREIGPVITPPLVSRFKSWPTLPRRVSLVKRLTVLSYEHEVDEP